MRHKKKLVFIDSEVKEGENINLLIQQFGNFLGLFSLRDKESSCFRIFIVLLRYAKKHEKISSQELAYKCNLTRGTVVHHLNRLFESGLIGSENNRYFLRTDNLSGLVGLIEKDVNKIIEHLKQIAEKIDKGF